MPSTVSFIWASLETAVVRQLDNALRWTAELGVHIRFDPRGPDGRDHHQTDQIFLGVLWQLAQASPSQYFIDLIKIMLDALDPLSIKQKGTFIPHLFHIHICLKVHIHYVSSGLRGVEVSAKSTWHDGHAASLTLMRKGLWLDLAGHPSLTCLV